MFRHGYKTEFPRQELQEEDVQQARRRDQQQKDQRQEVANSSCRIQAPELVIGQRVLVKNERRRTKFDPLFEPCEYTVVSKERNGVIVRNEEGATRRRHVNEVKPIPDKCVIQKKKKSIRFWVPVEQARQQPGQVQEGIAHAPPVQPQQHTVHTTSATKPGREKRPPPKLADYVL